MNAYHLNAYHVNMISSYGLPINFGNADTVLQCTGNTVHAIIVSDLPMIHV